jgi:hypothetical protein
MCLFDASRPSPPPALRIGCRRAADDYGAPAIARSANVSRKGAALCSVDRWCNG